jgi:hypothetical protein
MKCPKCGYHSFDYLDNCKKCSHSLIEHKAKYKLRGFSALSHLAPAGPEPTAAERSEELDASNDGSVDLGFDFLDENDDQNGKRTEDLFLSNDLHAVNIHLPFGVDSETIPADEPLRSHDDKPGKGHEFAF